jgi:putative spermidine/putrescine transport system ATP-binding protein
MKRRAEAITERQAGVVRLSNLTKHYGDVHALEEVSLTVRPGEFITLLGPSGSGKTTTLMIVAGFVTPDSGVVMLGDQELTRIPPYRREIGMVFQNYALFPHMTAVQNVSFPLSVRHVSRSQIDQKVREALTLVGLEHAGARYPRQLSGGQQQRVALARALVFRPRILLMDEPLGALDRKLREAMQLEILRISREVGVTVIYVTHDQEEALALSDRIAIYNAGRIEQVGGGEELYERPMSLFVAQFVGESTVFKGKLRSGEGQTRVSCPNIEIQVSADAVRRTRLINGDAAAVVVRPEWMRVEPSTSPESQFPGLTASVPGRLQEVIYLGPIRKYVVELANGTRGIARMAADVQHADLTPGALVRVSWPIDRGVVVPGERDEPTDVRESTSGEPLPSADESAIDVAKSGEFQ